MIFDRALRKSAGRASPVDGLLTLESARGWTGWTAEDAVALSRDKAMKLSTVSRCVELRANAIAMLPVYLMDETTKARLRDHPLGPLLWGPPNEVMSRYDYSRLMQCNLDLCGNAYAWIFRDSASGVLTASLLLSNIHVRMTFRLSVFAWVCNVSPLNSHATYWGTLTPTHAKWTRRLRTT